MAEKRALDEELETYERMKPEMLRAGLTGKWVVIKGQDRIGTFDTAETAYNEALKLLGAGQVFLLKQIAEEDERLSNPAYAVGAMRVHH